MESEQAHKAKLVKQTLLVAERKTYSLQRNEEGKVQRMVGKLLAKRDKPTIGALPKSPLLNQLQSFMPLMKQANQRLEGQIIPPSMTIDAKLQQLPDSSSSESEEEQAGPKQMAEQMTPQVLQSCDEIQLNIMTYPYLDKVPQKVEEKPKQVPKIQEMEEEKASNSLEELE